VPYEEARRRVEEALEEEGFGILTEIDVRATLKKKLDAEFRPYAILGACNPQLAHRALTTDDNIGLLLPCNVVVAALDGGSEVSMARPRSMLSLADNPAVRPVADEAEERIRRALDSL
jgi:uncharacterized protein (DUF302 family)